MPLISKRLVVADKNLHYLLLAASGFALIFMLWVSRGTAPYGDEWLWLIKRDTASEYALFQPHMGHLSVLSVIVFQLLLALGGLTHYWLFHLVTGFLWIGTAVATYFYVKPRLGAKVALLAGLFLLFLGGGGAAQNFIWGFQLSLTLSVLTGLLSLLCLDKQTKRGDIAAAVMLASAILASGIGILWLIVVSVSLLLERDRQRIWIPAVAATIFGCWLLTYGLGVPPDGSNITSPPYRENLLAMPAFSAKMAAMAFTSLLGFAADSLQLGWVLLVLTVTWLAVAYVRGTRFSSRAVAAITAVVAFWVLTGMTRANLGDPWAGRYIHPEIVLFVVAAAEIFKGTKVSSRMLQVLSLLVFCSIAIGLRSTDLQQDVWHLESQKRLAQIGVLNVLDTAALPTAGLAPGIPNVEATTDTIRRVQAKHGSIGMSEEQILKADSAIQNAADITVFASKPVGMRLVANIDSLTRSPVELTVSTVQGEFLQPAANGCRLAAVDQLPVTVQVAQGGYFSVKTSGLVNASFTRYGATPLGATTVQPGGTRIRFAADKGKTLYLAKLNASNSFEICLP